jgi:hypothetical protein
VDNHKPPPELETQLYRLTTAEDPADYAEQAGIELDADNRAKVVLELVDDDADAPADAEVEARNGRLVVVWVFINDLVAVAEADAVQFARRPRDSTQMGYRTRRSDVSNASQRTRTPWDR